MSSPAHHITVIIPTFNEEKYLPQTLEAVLKQEPPFKVVVADGGSEDATCQIAIPSATVLQVAKGRGLQMHLAAQSVEKTEVFLFLHADTLLPPEAFSEIRKALQKQEVIAGCFRLRFDDARPLMRIYGLFTRLPIRRMVFGDRAIFVRKTAYEQAGGFPMEPLFEDALLVRALRKMGQWAFLPIEVITSARRFQKNGRVLQPIWNVALFITFLLGMPPAVLSRWYR